MTELSPQAQEVFWAFNRAASGKPDDWHYLPAIAAALRAAALYCKRDRLQLIAIASELESQETRSDPSARLTALRRFDPSLQ